MDHYSVGVELALLAGPPVPHSECDDKRVRRKARPRKA
jgi:hypothetical protein